MTAIPRDQSRDRRIEDPTNLYLGHPAAHALLPWAVRHGIAANGVSIAGLVLGLGAATCFGQWADGAGVATLGLLLAVAWLIADGLDGMIARATDTASAIGRVLDGICDHGVFVLIYVALALSLGTAQGWTLAIAAGAVHAVQSNAYESERTRFHRRVRGDAGTVAPARTRVVLDRLYDAFAAPLDRVAARFDRVLARSPDPVALGREYAAAATPVMRAMALLSANMRVLAIWIACVVGAPQLFLWFEITILSVIALATIIAHRRVESRFFGSVTR